MKRADAKLKAALVLAALLSYPVLRGVLDGSIPITTGAVRIAVALVLSYGAVLLVTTVVGGYLPEPKPDEAAPTPELDGVEDAVLVEDLAAESTETEDAP